MISYIILYLLLGLAHMFLMDLVIFRINKISDAEEKIYFGHPERISTILVWPIMSFIFWFNVFKSVFRKP